MLIQGEISSDFMTVEVDGSLTNGVVGLAVLIWAIILCVPTAYLAAAWTQRIIGRMRHLLTGAILLFFLYSMTPFAQVFIARLYYSFSNPKWAGVCFWDGPPNCLVPLAGLASGGVVLLLNRQKS
jgi:hypothetical protein